MNGIPDFKASNRLLHIDSLNLMGISYCGGLMMAVLQMYPKHTRSLILDSPLPEFVNIDGALTSVPGGNDSTLLDRFQSYFGSLGGKVFTINYQLKDGEAVMLRYERSELSSIIHGKVEDYDGIKMLPQIIGDRSRMSRRISMACFRVAVRYLECDCQFIAQTTWHLKIQPSSSSRNKLCPVWMAFTSMVFTAQCVTPGKSSHRRSYPKTLRQHRSNTAWCMRLV